jgi:hypothetical protein
MLDALRSLYRRLGARYPRAVLLGGLPLAYATGVLAVAGTALYIDMSTKGKSEDVRLFAPRTSAGM